MKHIRTFETITSNSYADNKEYIQNLEEDITAIFVDLLDEYDLYLKLTDYPGNISTVKLSMGKISYACVKKTGEVKEKLHHFYDYIIEEGFGISDIYFNRQWISRDLPRNVIIDWGIVENTLEENFLFFQIIFSLYKRT